MDARLDQEATERSEGATAFDKAFEAIARRVISENMEAGYDQIHEMVSAFLTSETFAQTMSELDSEGKKRGFELRFNDYTGGTKDQSDGAYYGDVLVRMIIGQIYDEMHGLNGELPEYE